MALEAVFYILLIIHLFKETLSSHLTLTIKILITQKEINEKNNVWNQNVLQKIIVRKYGEILVWF